MSERIVSYIGAMRNYEKAIKRLRKQVWRLRQGEEARKCLEMLVSRYDCNKSINDCIRTCPDGSYPLHQQAAAINRPRHRPNHYIDRMREQQ